MSETHKMTVDGPRWFEDHAPPFGATLKLEIKFDSDVDKARYAREIDAALARAENPGHWSSTPPTKPGFYWVRFVGEARVRTCELIGGYPDGEMRFAYLEVPSPIRVSHHEWDVSTQEFWSEPIAEPPA